MFAVLYDKKSKILATAVLMVWALTWACVMSNQARHMIKPTDPRQMKTTFPNVLYENAKDLD